jgi:uncharacterized protein YndB with AHSA1/START domain
MAEPTDTTIEREARFPVPPAELWDAVTDPDLLVEWFGDVAFDLEPGGAITEGGADDAEPSTIGVVETFEPPRRIGFVWIAPGTDTPSSVELEIDDDTDPDGDDGSILHVREVRIEPAWEARPAWFAPRACAGARSRA